MTGPDPANCPERHLEMPDILRVIRKMKGQARAVHRTYKNDPCKCLRRLAESMGITADLLQTHYDILAELIPDDDN